MNQPPLNPDGVRAAEELMIRTDRITKINYLDAERIISAYLAAALPEVTSVEELDQLPLGTTVLGADRISYQMLGQSSIMGAEWWASGSEHRGIEVELPARVLHIPEVKP